MRALIVEPNLNLQRELLAALKTMEIEVCSARSPQQAQELARVARMHIIMVDASLEGHSDGLFLLETLRQQKRIGAGTAVFVLDTVREARHQRAAEEFGADVYLVKPFSQSELVNQLVSTLSRKRTLRPLEEALAKGNLPAVLELADTLLKEAPQYDREILNAKAEALIAQRRWEDADELFAVAAQTYPEEAWPRLGAARIALASGRVTDALARLKQPFPDHPDLLPAYDLLAHAHITRGSFRHAQQMLREAAQLSPLNLSRLRELIRLALLNGDGRVANEAGSQLVRRGADSGHFKAADFINVVRCAVLLERPGTATELLKQANAKFPDNPDIAVLHHLVDAHESLRADNLALAQRQADQGKRMALDETSTRDTPRLAMDIGTPEIVLAGIETCLRTELPQSGLSLAEALVGSQQSGQMQLTQLDDRLLARYQNELASRDAQAALERRAPPKPKSKWDKFCDWLNTPIW